ncbi:hypothetical protein WA026_008799 [Henosepilachna vigintioctopunctata]|uniref:Uncharacterized protein n=1 Tax=Henosepilachna vigintioctopunctata TaxID=420089 RepID=A0AAW1VB97_9CUCU
MQNDSFFFQLCLDSANEKNVGNHSCSRFEGKDSSNLPKFHIDRNNYPLEVTIENSPSQASSPIIYKE